MRAAHGRTFARLKTGHRLDDVMFHAWKYGSQYSERTRIVMGFLRRMSFVFGLLLLAGVSFFLTSKLLEGPGQRAAPRLSQGQAGKPASVVAVAKGPGSAQGSYCEVTFPVDNCPAYPGMFSIGPTRARTHASQP